MSENVDALRRQLNTPWEELTQEERDGWNAIEAAGIGASPTPPTTEGRPDIVARLRNDGSSWAQDLFNEAAEEIDRLRKAAP